MKLLKSKLVQQSKEKESEMKKEQYKSLDANSWSHQVLPSPFLNVLVALVHSPAVYDGEGSPVRLFGFIRGSHSEGRHGGVCERTAAKKDVH